MALAQGLISSGGVTAIDRPVKIPALGDTALDDALRVLLRATGARPFIRKNRALSCFSDYVPQNALRPTVALLADHQKKPFLERTDRGYAPGDADRHRVNLRFHRNGAAGAFRIFYSDTRTVEDPIQVAQHVKGSNVTRREVGDHTCATAPCRNRCGRTVRPGGPSPG